MSGVIVEVGFFAPKISVVFLPLLGPSNVSIITVCGLNLAFSARSLIGFPSVIPIGSIVFPGSTPNWNLLPSGRSIKKDL